MFHFSVDDFEVLFDKLKNRLIKKETLRQPIRPEVRLAIVLWYVKLFE